MKRREKKYRFNLVIYTFNVKQTVNQLTYYLMILIKSNAIAADSFFSQMTHQNSENKLKTGKVKFINLFFKCLSTRKSLLKSMKE